MHLSDFQNKPKISIIVPIYNVEKYLPECLISIQKQTYSNLEIILVNDGSSDNSASICKKVLEQDERFIYIEKENGGLSSARNYGIEKSTGDYLVFIDSDDYICEDMISVMLSYMVKYEADICCCNWDFVNENSELLKKNRINIKNVKIFDGNSGKKVLLSEKYFKCYAWNKMYKKVLFDDIRYPNGKLYEDIVAAFKLFDKSKNIVFCNDVLYHYRIRQDSITQKKFHVKKYDLLEALEVVDKNYSESSKEIKAGIALYYLYFIDDMINSNYWDDMVYRQYCDILHKIGDYITYRDICSFSRRMQMILCKKNIFVYKKLYLLLHELNYRILKLRR